MSYRLRSPGSAHAGLISWIVQRVSGVYLAGFVVYVVVRLLASPIREHAAWQLWFTSGWVRLAWALAIGSLLLHAWIGMRSVYLDYLHPIWLRFTVSFVTGLGLIAAGLWAVDILVRAGAA